MSATSLMYPIWRRIFKKAWILNLVLFMGLGALRAYGLFGPVSVRTAVMLNFFLMWFLPYIFFNKNGKREIGLKKAEGPIWLLWAILLGLASAIIIFLIGYGIYGVGKENWYVGILNSWAIDENMRQLPVLTLFSIFTLPAILFSPIGEEFFFRGMIHESISRIKGEKVALFVNAFAFGSIHLLHHGILIDHTGVHFMFVPGILWMMLMMGVSWIFTYCRTRSNSIWTAVIGHAAFNLGMNVSIFLVLMN